MSSSLHVHGNLPILLYSRLLSVIISSALRDLPYRMRHVYTCVLQIHADLEDAATKSAAGRAFIFVCVALLLIVPALISCWLFVRYLIVKQPICLRRRFERKENRPLFRLRAKGSPSFLSLSLSSVSLTSRGMARRQGARPGSPGRRWHGFAAGPWA
jgi:hypothetical protein